MQFGERVRGLRRDKGWRLRDLGGKVGVSHTYLSRVENERLNYGEYASDELIRRLAEALEADENELRLLAKRVPETIRRRVLERPDAFLFFAACDDSELDRILKECGQESNQTASSSKS